MQYTFGYTNPTTVNVTNKQGYVEYEILESFSDERDVRSAVGNFDRGTYEFHYSGWYSDRVKSIERMEESIKEMEEKIEKLKFSIRVTKKKDWRLKP